MALVARLRLVLADPHLRPAHVTDDLRAHRRARRQLAVALAADEEDVRLERLALLAVEPVHEQRLALVDDVLLSAEGDDRVVRAMTVETRARARAAANSSCSPSFRREPRPAGLLAPVAPAARPAARPLLRRRLACAVGRGAVSAPALVLRRPARLLGDGLLGAGCSSATAAARRRAAAPARRRSPPSSPSPGTWIVGVFLCLRPPREPRRVFFFARRRCGSVVRRSTSSAATPSDVDRVRP